MRARRIPHFGFDATDGGAGTDGGIARNAAALDAIELVPRYGIDEWHRAIWNVLVRQELCGADRDRADGLPGIVWPGAEKYLAMAAQAGARSLYGRHCGGVRPVEELAALAEDMLWFQLYRMPQRRPRDRLRPRAPRAMPPARRCWCITMDVPLRTKRPREVRRGLVLPFKMNARTVWDVLSSPAWLMAYLEHGLPRFSNYKPYIDSSGDACETRRLQQQGPRRGRRVLVG